jgi:hypothetical protein
MGKRCKVSEFQSSLNSNPDFGNAPPFALHKCSALKQKSLPTKILDRITGQTE